jgi:hypothetical protein
MKSLLFWAAIWTLLGIAGNSEAGPMTYKIYQTKTGAAPSDQNPLTEQTDPIPIQGPINDGFVILMDPPFPNPLPDDIKNVPLAQWSEIIIFDTFKGTVQVFSDPDTNPPDPKSGDPGEKTEGGFSKDDINVKNVLEAWTVGFDVILKEDAYPTVYNAKANHPGTPGDSYEIFSDAPEPSSLALLSIGSLGLIACFRRFRRTTIPSK